MKVAFLEISDLPESIGTNFVNGHIFGVFQRAVNGDKDVVKLLVSGSADPKKSEIYGKAPLPIPMDANGESLLHDAAKNGHRCVVNSAWSMARCSLLRPRLSIMLKISVFLE